jgi:hypothetical protein
MFMPPFDDARRELCAQLLARGSSIVGASRDAGYPRHGTRARERAAHPDMTKRLEEIHADMARQGDPDLGPVIDALMDAAAIAMTNKACESAAGLVAIRGLLAEAGKLKGFVPRTAPEDDDLMEPDLDDDAWMARFGPAAS